MKKLFRMKKLVRMVLFISLFFNMVNISWSAIPIWERNALIALYKSTNGDNWHDNSGWKSPPLYDDGFAQPGSEDKWSGISLNATHSAVSHINLSSNNLAGKIPDDIGYLPSLQTLDLSSNYLHGELPQSLGSLFNLVNLKLSNNQLSGSLPKTLRHLIKLYTLDLGSNMLSGQLPEGIHLLRQLNYLDLHANQFSGPIHSIINSGFYKNLKTLNVSSNLLTGAIPDLTYRFDLLTDLDLSANFLTGPIPPSIRNLKNLMFLNLHQNKFTGNLPEELFLLTELDKINLSANQLTGRIPSEIKTFLNLVELNLGENQLSGDIPSEFGNLKQLYRLDLHSNNLSGSIPSALIQSWELAYLDLSLHNFQGNIPPEIGRLIYLHALDLSVNSLTGSVPFNLANLNRLDALDLSSNKLTGQIPALLMELTNLLDNHSDFRWNSLVTYDKELKDFLDSKQAGGNWESTQTLPPEKISATHVSGSRIKISWTPTLYIGDEGCYYLYYSDTQGGPYTLYSQTDTKYDSELYFTGAEPNKRYYFRIKTETRAHEANPNNVLSPYSPETSAIATGNHIIISGKITTSSGIGIPNLNLIATPPGEYFQTDLNGDYRYEVKPGWSGTIQPGETGFTFTPRNQTISVADTHKPGVDFIASRITCTVSGKALSAGQGVGGVTLNFKSSDGSTESITTNDDGAYNHIVPYGWKGLIKPSKGNILFYPPTIEKREPGITEDLTMQNLTLAASVALTVERKSDSTLLLNADYATIEFKAFFTGISPEEIKHFKILRKENNGQFVTIAEREATSPYQFTYTDRHLKKEASYTYVGYALDESENIIGQSTEVTI